MAISLGIENIFSRSSSEDKLRNDEVFLVNQCIKENGLAQKVLYETYYEKMLGVCYRYAGDSMAAEDMLHESFMKVFTKLDKFNFESKLSTWLHKVVTNNCLDILRKKKSDKLQFLEEIPNHLSEADIREEEIEGIDCEALIQTMHLLPEGYRNVLMLYSIDGFTHDEIATTLGISPVTSRSQLNRARKQFRKLLEERGISYGK